MIRSAAAQPRLAARGRHRIAWRRVFAALAPLHALFFLALCIVWCFSRDQTRYARLQCADTTLHLFVGGGRMLAYTDGYERWAERSYWSRDVFAYDGRPMLPVEERTFAIEFGGASDPAQFVDQSLPRGRWRDFAFVVPIWAAALVMLPGWLLPLLAFGLRRTCRRRGGCANCGYDLRATPSRCPECGAIATDIARRA